MADTTCSQSAHAGRTRGTAGEKAPLFTDTFLWSTKEVMPDQTRQSRLSGLFEHKAMHVELEEA